MVITPVYPHLQVGEITHLLIIDPNFQRDIQVVNHSSLGLSPSKGYQSITNENHWNGVCGHRGQSKLEPEEMSGGWLLMIDKLVC